MIPFAIANALWQHNNQKLDLTILELHTAYFTTRLPLHYHLEMSRISGCFTFRIYSFAENCYHSLNLHSVRTELMELGESYEVWKIAVTDQEEYAEAVQKVSAEYMKYIHLYMEEETEVLSKELTGYPAELEEVFPENLQELQKELINKELVYEHRHLAQGIMADNPWQYEKLCALGIYEYLNWYQKEARLHTRLFAPGDITYLYLGSQVCMQLMPDIDRLFRMLKLCEEAGKIPVLQLPPVKQHELEQVMSYLNLIAETGKEPLEVVVNDWGMLDLLAGNPKFSLTMGILLLKQRKDTRMQWKNGQEELTSKQKQSGWMSDTFLDICRQEFQVSRFSVESSAADIEMPEVPITIYAPWYQMNTSTLCMLRASVLHGDRGWQEECDNCRFPCRTYTYLYPEHLKMCGRYNTIWGFEARGIHEMIKRCSDQKKQKGADRLVWNLFL